MQESAITIKEMRSIIREVLIEKNKRIKESFGGFSAYDSQNTNQKIGVDVNSDYPPPRTVSFNDFYGHFQKIGGAVLDKKSMKEMWEEYKSGMIEWADVEEAAVG